MGNLFPSGVPKSSTHTLSGAHVVSIVPFNSLPFVVLCCTLLHLSNWRPHPPASLNSRLRFCVSWLRCYFRTKQLWASAARTTHVAGTCRFRFIFPLNQPRLVPSPIFGRYLYGERFPKICREHKKPSWVSKQETAILRIMFLLRLKGIHGTQSPKQAQPGCVRCWINIQFRKTLRGDQSAWKTLRDSTS